MGYSCWVILLIVSLFLTTTNAFIGPFMKRRSKLSSLFGVADKNDHDVVCDVLVLGAGPSGRAVSTLLASNGVKVVLADANYDRSFVPNYGVWQDEWEAVVRRYQKMGVTISGAALDRIWNVTDCFFGGSFDIPTTERLRLDRPYCRIDKDALQQSLTNEENIRVLRMNHVSQAMGINLYGPTLVHDAEGSTTLLKGNDDNEAWVRSRLVVDTTGHETKLVLRDTQAPGHRPPGFQIAYGCLLKLNKQHFGNQRVGPYDKDAMTLFDYRTDHFDNNGDWNKKAETSPTFMYVMPLDDERMFFEETSLVARPAVSFQECQDRCFRRLQHLGIEYDAIEEEEYCYIPMGGALPIKGQRVIGLGGSAAMVHPSTGYHLCRMLMGVADAAQTILQNQQEARVDLVSARVYDAVWSQDNINQRNFAVFGGEFLMQQDVVGLRGFFDGFFRLPLELWAGFLAGWPGLPNNDKHETWYGRLYYGLTFITKLPVPVALAMLQALLAYLVNPKDGITMLQSVTPLFDKPKGYIMDPVDANVGDVAAKTEARNMIQASKVTETLPKDFESTEETTPTTDLEEEQELLTVA